MAEAAEFECCAKLADLAESVQQRTDVAALSAEEAEDMVERACPGARRAAGRR